MTAIKKLQKDSVVTIYRIPYKRKRPQGNATLLRQIYEGEKCDLWEVEFTDTLKVDWHWIYKGETVPDDWGKKKR